MSDVNDWIKERRAIHDATTGGWEHDEEDGGNFWTGGGRSDFHLTPEDARSAVDAHNTLPTALTMIEKVLELHPFQPFTAKVGYCATCRESFPCQTVRAIEGEGNE